MYGVGLCDSVMSFSVELCNTDAGLGKDLDSIYTSLWINQEALGNTTGERKTIQFPKEKLENNGNVV